MTLAAEHYRALLAQRELPQTMAAEDASQVLREIITDTQQLTLSQLSTSTERQLGSILFSHEAGLVSALGTVNEPTLKKQPSQTSSPLNITFLLLAILTAVAAAAMSWESNAYIWSIFMGCSALLSGGAYFTPRKKTPAQIEQGVDTRLLFGLAERRMEAIDRDLDAFLSIPTEAVGGDDSIVHLITLANKLKMEDPDSVPDELMTSITALSIANGYDFVEFCEETENLFDTMPTKRETRTIVPAVLKNGSLIARGMAIVTMTDEAEDA